MPRIRPLPADAPPMSWSLAQAETAKRTGRWTADRKACLLLALRRNEITFDQACQRYDISPGELIEWQERFRVAGRDGLAVGKVRVVG